MKWLVSLRSTFVGAAASVEVRMQNAQSGERHEIESTIQAKVILRDTGDADLCEVSDRREERHPAERKILIHVVIEPEAKRESRIVRRAGPEAEIGGEAPACLLHLR